MGFRLKKTEVVTLSNQNEARQLASKLKGFGGTESEREEALRRKKKIREKLLSNETTPFRWCVGKVTETGMKRRVNGQHSSEVFLDLTAEEWAQVDFPLIVIWEEYECDTLQDLPILFEQFDPHWSGRNTQDLIGAHLGIHQELYRAVNRFVAAKATAGILWHRQKVEGLKLSSEHQYALVHEDSDNQDFLRWCGSFLQKGKTDEMHAQPVTAAMYHTFRSSREKAQAFWLRVSGGKPINDADSVEYKLSEFLEMLADKQAEWPRTITKHFHKGSASPSPLDVFATCLRAFYASVNGTKVGDIFYPSKGKNAVEIVEEFAKAKKAA